MADQDNLAGKRWRELMLRSPFGIAVYRPDGAVKFANRRMSQIFDLTDEEAELATLSYNILQDRQLDDKGVRQHVRRAFAGEACYLPRIAYDLLTPLRKQRVRKWLQGVIYPIQDRHGNLQEVVAVQMDVSDLEKAQSEAAASREELRQRLKDLRGVQQRYRQLFDNAPLMYAITRILDGDPVIEDCNSLFASRLEYEKADIIGKKLQDFYTTPSQFELLADGGYQRALEGSFQTSERELVTKSGRVVTALLFAAPDKDADGTVMGTRAMFVDISEAKMAQDALRQSESKYRSLFEEALDAVFLTTRDGRWIDANPAAVSLFGFSSKKELLETDISTDIFQDPNDRKELMSVLETKGFVRSYELSLKTAHGQPLTVIESSRVIRGPDGAVLGYHGILHDVTDTRQMEKKLEHQAFHDSLTDLPNRAKLHRDYLEIIDAERSNRTVAIALLDLDRFKEVNDALGHQVGDRLLKQIGPRLTSKADLHRLQVYRLGGDEFALLIRDLRDAHDAEELVRQLLGRLRRPITIEGLTLEIGASAGVAIRPKDGRTSGELLRCADVAMYEAKRTATGVACYSREFDPHSAERLELMAELRQALNAQALTVYYQPKVALEDGALVGFEALVRWPHPSRGLLSAAEFIPLAEVGNLIHPLTYWVTREALDQLRRWSRRHPHFSMAVNLSARVLIDRSSAKELMTIVTEAGVDPACVEFEVTETALLVDPQVAMETLSKLAVTGVRIAIDDFGTGYSSLAHLKQGFIQTLKIDRSFVNDMLENDHSRAIVDAIVQMSRRMNLMAVAEGVEDGATRQALKSLGCNAAQGFFFCRPAPPAEIEQQLLSSAGEQGL